MDSLAQGPDARSGKRERNRLNNRNAILMAARECFRDIGYDNTTIRDIVRHTGLAAGTFYNYFSSKQDLFSALLTGFLSQLNQNIAELRRSALTDNDFIESTYLALFRATASEPLVYELAHRNDRTIHQLFGSDILGLAIVSLEEDVREAVSRGLLPDVDQEYLCAAFFGVACELSLRVARRAQEHPERAKTESDHAARFATALFLGGLERLKALS